MINLQALPSSNSSLASTSASATTQQFQNLMQRVNEVCSQIFSQGTEDSNPYPAQLAIVPKMHFLKTLRFKLPTRELQKGYFKKEIKDDAFVADSIKVYESDRLQLWETLQKIKAQGKNLQEDLVDEFEFQFGLLRTGLGILNTYFSKKKPVWETMLVQRKGAPQLKPITSYDLYIQVAKDGHLQVRSPICFASSAIAIKPSDNKPGSSNTV